MNTENTKRPDRLVPFCAAAFVVALLALTWLLAGCATGNPFTRAVRTVATNEVVRMVTNTVAVAVPLPPEASPATNPAAGGGEARMATGPVERPPAYVTRSLVSFITNHVPVEATNYIVNPALAAGIEAARRVNSALNPTPSAPMVDWGLTALGGIAALVAGWQTRRANRATRIGDTVIRAVELYPGAGLKQHVARVAEMSDAAELVDRRVQAVTARIAHAMSDGRLDANELHSLAMDPAVGVRDVPEIYRKAFAAFRENMPPLA